MMRGLSYHLVTLIIGGTCAALSACAIPLAASAEGEFQLSFAAGSRDSAGNYFAGYDANKAPAHNTAWIFRATLATALGAAR